jgi:hypothetical protein
MTFPILGGNGAVGGYNIDNSLRLSRADSAHLDRTPSSAGNRRTFTISTWFKRGEFSADPNQMIVGAGTSAPYFLINLLHSPENEQIEIQLNAGVSTIGLRTNRLFRDVSAWYHLVLVVDTTNATADNRVRLYINGVEETSFATRNNPSLNFDSPYNNTIKHTVGDFPNGSNEFDGYLAEFHSIDGQALSPTDFGEFDEDSGIWKPIRYSGSYGTNGFKLDFSNSGSLGADSSGNGNNFTATNLTSTDQTTDTCTNNFATMNPLIPDGSVTLAEGNLKVSSIGDNDWRSGTFGGSFKWYAECKINVAHDGSGGGICIGAISEDGLTENNGGTFGMSFKNAKWYSNSNDGKFQQGNGTDVTTGLTRASTNDIVGVACDGANGRIYIHVNGTYLNSGDPVGGSGFIGGTTGYQGIWFPFSGSHLTKGQGSWNFGNPPFSITSGNSDDNGYGNFEYAPPSGYLALCTQNLATALSPTIDDGSEHFNTAIYTGTGSSHSITGLGFQPDFNWIKNRGATNSHNLRDSTRGITKVLASNLTVAEFTNAGYVTSFDSDGFSLADSGGDTNASGNTYVAWNWKANGGTTSSNTSGSITSTVQANTTAGFSIVTYTGTGSNATVGHGLSKAPEIIIVKNRDYSPSDWQTGSDYLTSWAYRLKLNGTNAEASVPSSFNSTAPTSTVINIGNNDDVNRNGDAHIIYAFHSVEGYSKIGSYTGNGSTDGTFVYTGFRPTWFLAKRTSDTSHWTMLDGTRNSFNVAENYLHANELDAENTNNQKADFLSNGIKLRSIGRHNDSGSTYIYMAFAENPFVDSNGVPVTAR